MEIDPAPECLSFGDRALADGSGYKHDDGQVSSCPVEYIQYSLGFCCCGIVEESLIHILSGLRLINEKFQGDRLDRDGWGEWWKEWKGRCHQTLGGESGTYFFWYWADAQGLTEHGGGVPGWLTTDGESMLSDLEYLDSIGAFTKED
jgi:hypothetical protein